MPRNDTDFGQAVITKRNRGKKEAFKEFLEHFLASKFGAFVDGEHLNWKIISHDRIFKSISQILLLKQTTIMDQEKEANGGRGGGGERRLSGRHYKEL